MEEIVKKAVDYIYNEFNELLKSHQLDIKSNNDICDLRNKMIRCVRNILNDPIIYKKYGAAFDSLKYLRNSSKSYIEETSNELGHIPYDAYESELTERTLNKEKIFIEKINQIKSEVSNLFHDIYSESEGRVYLRDIESVILKVFLFEFENRPFKFKSDKSIFTEVALDGIIKNRNIPCEICGENRAVDKCHIIPSFLGGLLQAGNIIFLCPTHHRLFDNTMLSEEEWNKINFSRILPDAKEYANLVIKKALLSFWKDVKSGNYTKYTATNIVINEFHNSILHTILDLINKQSGIKQTAILSAFSTSSKKYILQLLKYLYEINAVKRDRVNRTNSYSLLIPVDEAYRLAQSRSIL
jgi:hypothetical protein